MSDWKSEEERSLGFPPLLLVVLTFGIGFVFLSYRHWKFFVTHLDAHGEILLDELTQSQTRTARHGEGLLDAFDMGAI